MDKISVFLFDTSKYSFEELLRKTKISEEEVFFLNKYKVNDVKKEKLISYYFKKKYVGEYSLNDFGKPISKNIYFNISNSKGIVVIALSKKYELGIDIEVPKIKDEDLIKYVCSDEELEFVKNERDFFSIWTNKESIGKCLGTGINGNIKGLPGLPLCGKKEYKGQKFYTKTFNYMDSIISLTANTDEEFEYNLMMEDE